MSIKHLRTVVAALALVVVAAVPAHADPWATDAAINTAVNAGTSPAHTGGSPDTALQARSEGLNHRYDLGGSSARPLVVYEAANDDGFDWASAGIGAAVVLVAAGTAAAAVRRRPAITG